MVGEDVYEDPRLATLYDHFNQWDDQDDFYLGWASPRGAGAGSRVWNGAAGGADRRGGTAGRGGRAGVDTARSGLVVEV